MNRYFDEEHLELPRLRFCLQCSTGIRFGDLHSINKENIKGDRIHLVPQKTKRYNKKAIIDLNYYSRKIIEKLNYDTSTLKIENAPYNRNLKKIFEKMQTEYPNMNFSDNYGTHNGREREIHL